MDLPSFLWLWKIAAWSMGLSVMAYLLLGMTGSWMLYTRMTQQQRPRWLRPFHYIVGGGMVTLVIFLLGIGVVGTLGHYGSLGHSWHLPAGLTVVVLVLLSAGSATQISPQQPWARLVHMGINSLLFLGLAVVSITGWMVVQKYLP